MTLGLVLLVFNGTLAIFNVYAGNATALAWNTLGLTAAGFVIGVHFATGEGK